MHVHVSLHSKQKSNRDVQMQHAMHQIDSSSKQYRREFAQSLLLVAGAASPVARLLASIALANFAIAARSATGGRHTTDAPSTISVCPETYDAAELAK